jgi:iron uptake system EfeUOB component EfeO/EfeM
MPKEQLVTKKYLDKKLEEHSQIIVSAVDEILTKRLEKMDEKMDKRFNSLQVLIDSYVKEQEGFKQEFVIMKEEMRQIKSALKKKLGIQIRAI